MFLIHLTISFFLCKFVVMCKKGSYTCCSNFIAEFTRINSILYLFNQCWHTLIWKTINVFKMLKIKHNVYMLQLYYLIMDNLKRWLSSSIVDWHKKRNPFSFGIIGFWYPVSVARGWELIRILSNLFFYVCS